MVGHWHELGEVENNCTSHKSILCAISVSKIIKVSGNLTKLWQKTILQFFLGGGNGAYIYASTSSAADRLSVSWLIRHEDKSEVGDCKLATIFYNWTTVRNFIQRITWWQNHFRHSCIHRHRCIQWQDQAHSKCHAFCHSYVRIHLANYYLLLPFSAFMLLVWWHERHPACKMSCTNNFKNYNFGTNRQIWSNSGQNWPFNKSKQQHCYLGLFKRPVVIVL